MDSSERRVLRARSSGVMSSSLAVASLGLGAVESSFFSSATCSWVSGWVMGNGSGIVKNVVCVG